MLAVNGVLSRLDGLILVCGAIVYTAVLIHIVAAREPGHSGRVATQAFPAATERGEATKRVGGTTVQHVVMTVTGNAVVILGARVAGRRGGGDNREFEVPDALIGLTVVAIGTSAPELVTTIVST